jgi:Holliday junction resolvase
MPVNSKQKGARFERELAKYFRDNGYDTRRTAQYCGNTGEAADISGLPGIHVEAKHQETLRLKDWVEQAVHDSSETGRLPAVFHRKNNEKVLVTMRLDDWMELYKAYEKSRGTS